MKKKIALVLIMVMLINCVAWAGETPADSANEGLIFGAVMIGGGLVLALGIILVVNVIAEADTPDNGLRMASLSRSQTVSETGLGPVLDVLQHVDLGVTPENKAYVGFRFQF